nr:MAG TPA: Helicase ATPase REPLICATION [Caudoviricetes sp.]
MKFDEVLNKIKTNRENNKSGYYNCIPFEGFDRFKKIIPGIRNSEQIIITASSGVGKTQLAKYMFIQSPLNYVRNHPELNIKLDIIWFSLEDSKEMIICSEISRYLFSKYRIRISPTDILSVGENNMITDEVMAKIEESRVYVESFLSSVQVVDNIYNNTGFFKYCRDFALKIGRYYDKNNKMLSPQEHYNIVNGIGEDYKKIAYYKKNEDRHYVIVLLDHLSLIQTEKGQTLRESMEKLSNYYFLNLKNKFGFTNIIVQQQNATKETIEMNFQGKTFDEKLEPSYDGLADSKATFRDATLVIGLFSPNRYNIKVHNGYDILKMKDHYRSLSIMKNRYGLANKKLPLFFDGATNHFEECPTLNDLERLNNMYNLCKNLDQ